MEGVRLLKADNARDRYLRDEGQHSELARLLEAARISESPLLYPFVLLTLVTGGRRSEVLGLTWDRVDLEAGTVLFEHTKNGDSRCVSITPEVVGLLKPRQGIGKVLLFPSPNDPSRPVDIRSAWETALRRAGIEDFRIHDLRHTAASYAAMEGATSAELAGILGHRTLAMVKRYSHLSPDHVARASAKIGARIGRRGGA
jgi:integrase